MSDRAEFEKWQSEEKGRLEFGRYEFGSYVDDAVEDDWRVWQAARQAPASGDVEPAGYLHPAVFQFAKHMQIKLDANKHKDGKGWDRNPDGSRNGWSGCSEFFLRGKLREEVSELEEALISGDKEQIRLEAADVGNIAMMLADNFGGLSYTHPPEKVTEGLVEAVMALDPDDDMFGIDFQDEMSTYACRYCDFDMEFFGTTKEAVERINHDKDCPVQSLRNLLTTPAPATTGAVSMSDTHTGGR